MRSAIPTRTRLRAARWAILAGLGVLVASADVARAIVPGGHTKQEMEQAQRGRGYIESRSLFPVLVQLPDDYDPEAEYPLIVGLHGHGARANEFFTPTADMTAPAGVIYAVPQAPYAYERGAGIGYSWNLRGVDNTASDPGDTVTIAYVLDVVAAMRERYAVGDVFLMGFSQGGSFAYRTAIRHHEQFEGLIAFGAPFNPDWFDDGELAAASHLKVFLAGGTTDRIAQLERARQALEPLGYEVDVYEFEGGHVISLVAIERMIDLARR